jgi:hypothetical protein
MPFVRRVVLSAALSLMLSTISFADGGRILAEREVDDLRLVLFALPTPLRAGPADLSVYLERTGKHGPLLDASVAFRLNKLSAPTPDLAWKGRGCVTPGTDVPAIRGHAGNRFLYSSQIGIPEPGLWDVGVMVEHHGQRRHFSFEVEVAPALSPVWEWWPLVSIVPLGIVLYAWRALLLRRRIVVLRRR